MKNLIKYTKKRLLLTNKIILFFITSNLFANEVNIFDLEKEKKRINK